MKIEGGEKEKFLLGDMEDDNHRQELQVERRIYTVKSLNVETDYESPSKKTLVNTFRKRYNDFSCCRFLYATVPILKWLPEYQWRNNFYKDVISGLTVAVMHIPQGMAYGLLGNVPPIIGIYMAFFPVLVYVIFGTSRHVSMGTFAVVCLMTGKVVHEHSTWDILQNGTVIPRPGIDSNAPQYTNIEVAYTVTFTVAMIQLVMYLLRLGLIATLLSDTLVDGFTCASAFHVIASQLKDLLGLPTKKKRGYFSFIFTIYESARNLPRANITAVTVSVITMSLLIFSNKIIKPRLKKVTMIPLPTELLAVSFGTLASYLMNFDDNYGVSTVGNIPTGLPYPALPKFELIPSIVVDCFVITVVSYSITVSMGLIFARMLHYEINFNQELLAMGLSNVVGSCFSAMPITASLSRSMIQQAVGGVTQLASVVSCCILLLILLWIGPVFENLPRCVLASIIIIALWTMVMKIKLVSKYWKLSRWDGIVFVVTFGVTVFIDISIGLAVGLLVAMYSIFMQGHNPYTSMLGVVPNTDIYLDTVRHKSVQEIDGIKIFRYAGGINFVSKTVFRKILNKRIGFDPAELLRLRALMEYKDEAYITDPLTVKCVILDFSAVTYIDPTGVSTLSMIQQDFNDVNVEMYIAGCPDTIYEMFMKCDRISDRSIQFKIFPTIHDAVLYARHNVLNHRS